ncbi:hypothetical protein Pmar_PMAR023226 [Perkinsus marinus ATCC 50983]|uniref:Uncharacterized protein n=1 Tax=Perkinsus marinus (strain ATCC 50983 / TXsc) TaxID=423536 RepID=C5LJI5_PERM5|nr:hypothetical protein Pmar_PMAR023226 [Perkinsus marinus ATCC 50983]EER03114.1 hypothetical protein Pmar_PMAR023226 [Perkinsus marinus ATCC 50983]|eukprot:XP_002771298.1 hypothetical protein Pmar_PMAR023226 [Perkinsus marinus ATCC 50983]
MNQTPASTGSSPPANGQGAAVPGSSQSVSAAPTQPPPNAAFGMQFLSAWSEFSSGLFIRDREKFEEYREMQKQVALLRAQDGEDDSSSEEEESSEDENPQVPPPTNLASRIGHRNDYKQQMDAAENAFYSTQMPTFPDDPSTGGPQQASAAPPDMISFDSPDVWGPAAAGVAVAGMAAAQYGSNEAHGGRQAEGNGDNVNPFAMGTTLGGGQQATAGSAFEAFDALTPAGGDQTLPQGYIPPPLGVQGVPATTTSSVISSQSAPYGQYGSQSMPQQQQWPSDASGSYYYYGTATSATDAKVQQKGSSPVAPAHAVAEQKQ